MAKTYSWSTDVEEVRRLFTLTFDDLHFLEPLRADAQRLYRALVLVWARVERVLVSDPGSIPEEVITHVSRQLSLKPSVLTQLHNHPQLDQRRLKQCVSIWMCAPGRSRMQNSYLPT